MADLTPDGAAAAPAGWKGSRHTGVVLALLLTAGAVIGVQMAPEIFPVEVGAKIPAFTAVDLATSDSVPLSHYEGSVTLLNIWATWCEPCLAQMTKCGRRPGEPHRPS